MRKNEFSNVIGSNFEQINDSEYGSTSLEHRTLHKLYVQTRVKDGRYDEYGRLKSIFSEKIFYNQLSGNPITIRLPDGTEYKGESEYGDLRIDCYEVCSTEGARFTHNVEVLVGYPRNFYFPCSFRGFELAENFSYYMLGSNYFTKEMKTKFDKDIKIKRSDFERRNRTKLDCMFSNKQKYAELCKNKLYRVHYHISSGTDSHKRIDYGDFDGMAEIESETERKWRHYHPLADKLSLVIPDEYLWDYVLAIKKLLDKHNLSLEESGLHALVTIPRFDMQAAYAAAKKGCRSKCKGISRCRHGFSNEKQCTGENIIYSTSSVIHLSRNNKYNVNMQIRFLDDLLGN
ncbi:MAG: hypothetical protein PHC66_05010 [Candidatus Nanoarchaeia archaeon]|nr:hypothetical protein [Candidatus Nanoarchaeia archaeon]MDD5239755.1 hypothetical protein [Candidatus Nanoarchaeia archaeon]